MILSLREKIIKEAIALYVEEKKSEYDFIEKLNIEFSPEFEKKMEKLIKRQKKPYYRLINTAAKRVACIIAVLIIAAVSTVLSADALREGVKNFFVEVYEKFSTVFSEKDIGATDTIEIYYAPSFIPEGYEIKEIIKEASVNRIEYKNKDGKEIIYKQLLIKGKINVNTENEAVEEISNGLYISQSKFGQQIYFWNDGKYRFVLYAHENISKDELLKIADSLKAEK